MYITEKRLKIGRIMYVLEAAFEYFISILVAGSFLATLTAELGMSDSLTGILSSVISLGCLFQLLSVTVRPARLKPTVVVMSILNQLLFMLLYVVPLFDLSNTLKSVLFTVFIFAAYFIYNVAHPKKINWLFSLVEDSRRGRFTANKEIISLISGMLFTFAMGAVIDYFKDKGEQRAAFAISAAVIFLLMLLHTASMLAAPERITEADEKKRLRQTVSEILKNKAVLKITVVFVVYYIATYASQPFYGTYQIHELGLSLKLVSAITMAGSVSRILFSRLWGSYADHHGFADMMRICLVFSAAAYAAATLAVPSNGGVMFTLYYIFYGIAQGGINSALINLIFDYSSNEQRADSLSICQALSGLAGFLSTLGFSAAVKAVQKNSNRIFGMLIYPQQAVSFVSLLLTALLFVYISRAFGKKQK